MIPTEFEQKATERAQAEVRPSHGPFFTTGAFHAMVESGVNFLAGRSEEDKETFIQAGREVVVYLKKHPLG